MKKLKLYSSSLAAAAAMLVTPVVAAQDEMPLEFPKERNLVGLGLFAVPDYYGSQDSQGAIAPLVRYGFAGKRYVHKGYWRAGQGWRIT